VFKELANLGALLRNAAEINQRMKGMGEELRARRITGSAGGGLVEIEVNGLVEVLRCHIDPQLIAQGDREMIEELVASAVNQAVAKAKEVHAESIRSVTGGIQLPGMEEMMASLTGAQPPEGPESGGS